MLGPGAEEGPRGPGAGPLAGGQVQGANVPLLEAAEGGVTPEEGQQWQGGGGGRERADEAAQSEQHQLPNGPHQQHRQRPAEGPQLSGVVMAIACPTYHDLLQLTATYHASLQLINTYYVFKKCEMSQLVTTFHSVLQNQHSVLFRKGHRVTKTRITTVCFP